MPLVLFLRNSFVGTSISIQSEYEVTVTLLDRVLREVELSDLSFGDVIKAPVPKQRRFDTWRKQDIFTHLVRSRTLYLKVSASFGVRTCAYIVQPGYVPFCMDS